MELNDLNTVEETTRKTEIGPDGLPLSNINPDGLPASPIKEPATDQESSEEEESSKGDKKGPVGRFATVMNILNSLLGAGILSVANSFVNCGLIPSIFLMLLMAILSYIASVMLLKLQRKFGSNGFDDLAFLVMGRWGSLALSILSLLFLICALLSYMILGGDSLLSWFQLGGLNLNALWPRAGMIAVYGLCLPIALTIPRNMKFLQYVSSASVIFIIFFDCSMAYKCISRAQGPEGIAPSVSMGKFGQGVFSALSIYGVSFAMPAVILPVIRMYNTNVTKRSLVSLYAMILGYIFVCIPGVTGYLMFGDDTADNVLKSFPDSDILILVNRCTFFLIVSFAYPAVAQAVMGSWSEIVFHESNPAGLPTGKRTVILVLNNGIPLLIAMFLASAKPALSIGGALGGCLVDFVFPGIMWIMTMKKKWYSVTGILCILLILFGVVSAVIATYLAVVDAIKAFS